MSSPKMNICNFKIDYYAVGEIHYFGLTFTFAGYEVQIESKTPKTYEEFKTILEEYENREERLEKNARKVIRKYLEENELDD